MNAANICVAELQLKNIRCFKDTRIVFQSPLSVIIGANGSGKTSILEALHYACYFRSFRTHAVQDMIAQGSDTFFCSLSLGFNGVTHILNTGFSVNKRLITLDGAPIASHKKLLDYYRVVVISEFDLELVTGAPEGRRSFIDHCLLLGSEREEVFPLLKHLKSIISNRMHLVATLAAANDEYCIWTERLLGVSGCLRTVRIRYLAQLEAMLNTIGPQFLGENIAIRLHYQPKEWKDDLAALYRAEKKLKRSMCGAHLDDIVIEFNGMNAKKNCSRGQQKLVALLLKVAHMSLEQVQCSKQPPLLLIDDFFSDFDPVIQKKVLSLIMDMGSQVVLTVPEQEQNSLPSSLRSFPFSIINLSM